MKSTNVGLNLNNRQEFRRFFLYDYCKSKYFGLPDNEIRVILHTYYQLGMKNGNN